MVESGFFFFFSFFLFVAVSGSVNGLCFYEQFLQRSFLVLE